jgi:hypothetical protein
VPGIKVLEKRQFEPTLAMALKGAIGWGYDAPNYAYVVGTTADQQKAKITADMITKLMHSKGYKVDALVMKPKGYSDFYVTVGNFGTNESASIYATLAKETGVNILPEARTEESKRAAALLIGGQVVDARAMFHGNTHDRD